MLQICDYYLVIYHGTTIFFPLDLLIEKHLVLILSWTLNLWSTSERYKDIFMVKLFYSWTFVDLVFLQFIVTCLNSLY